MRPQLLDRFGLHAEVKTDHDLDRRVDIVERRNAYERDPQGFCAKLTEDQEHLRNKITRAQKTAGSVLVERSLLRQIAQLCMALKIDGHRGELTITRAASALAAFEGRKKVTANDVCTVSSMALRHRLRKDPLEEAGGTERILQAMEEVFAKQPGKRDAGSGGGGPANGGKSAKQNSGSEAGYRRAASVSRSRGTSANPNGELGSDSGAMPSLSSAFGFKMPETALTKSVVAARGQSKATNSGSRRNAGLKQTSYGSQRGKYARAVSFTGDGRRIALDATLRASAGAGCRVPGARSSLLRAPDTRHPTPVLASGTRHMTTYLRYKQLSRKSGRLFIFAIDASGSMAFDRIRQAKGAALSLLKQSYVKRDRVAIVGFRGTSAEVLLPPSRSMLRARRVLDSLRVGGERLSPPA